MATLEIRLLGGFTVRRDGEEVPASAFGGRLVRQLVRVLAARRGEVVSRDVLTELLWPRQPPADPAANLNALVGRARRALGDRSLVRTEAGGYALAGGRRCVVDVEEVRGRVAAGARHAGCGAHREALAAYEAALASWHGEPLPEDAYAEWAQPLRVELWRVHQQAVEGAAAAALAVGQPDRAVRHAARAAAIEPLREPAARLLARALAAAGDRAGALAAIARLRQHLADELGLDPSPDTDALQRAILCGEPVAPAAGGGPAPAVAAERHGPEPLGFVGRERELGTLTAVVGHPPRVAVVAGRSGAGKSRLLAEAARRVATPHLGVSAVLAERDDPWGLATALLRAALAIDAAALDAVPPSARDQLAELLPELAVDVAAGSPVDFQSRRALVLEGGLRLLAAATGDGALVTVDDLQWADATSLGLLSRVVERVPTLALVVAYRPEEVAAASPVAEFLGTLRASVDPAHVELGPLAPEAIAELVDERRVAGVLADETDRSPFAVGEVLRALAAEGLAERGADGRWRARPDPGMLTAARAAARAGQRRSVATRMARQPAVGRGVLAALALLGRAAPARLLAAATGCDEPAVLDALSRLDRAGLVSHRELGWATAHDLIAETVAGELDASDRVRLHQGLASALPGADADPAEVARHLAGADDPRAAGAYAAAAQQRLRHHAAREAVDLADAGFAGGPGRAVRSALHEIRGEARARQGDLRGARADLRHALGQRDRREERAGLLARMAMLASGAEDLLHAGELAELALVEAGADPAARASALAVAAIVDMNTGHPERSRERADEALGLFERLGDARGVADILDGRAMATFLDGDIRGAAEAFARAAQLFFDSGDLLRVPTPRSTRGHALVFMGRAAEGLADAEAALELAGQLGHPEGRAFAAWHGAEALAALGRSAEAEARASEALAIARRIGHRGWTATALLALGVAHEAAGRPDRAADALRRSLEASTHLPLFAAWAHARLARLAVAAGEVDTAGAHVEQAGELHPPHPPLAGYEVRLAQVELAVARGEAGAPAQLRAALAAAHAGGHLVSTARLERLAASAGADAAGA